MIEANLLILLFISWEFFKMHRSKESTKQYDCRPIPVPSLPSPLFAGRAGRAWDFFSPSKSQ